MANPNVLINTSYGPITVELYPNVAPITVANFLRYVDDSFYDRTIFHRVIADFMIQGGGLSQSVANKTTYGAIKLESNSGLSNTAGSIAMARTALADSATSQFFINTVDNPFLDYQSPTSPGYAVFGKVIDGMDVATAISTTPVASVSVNGVPYQNFPYPYLIPIYSIDRFTLSDAATPTSLTRSTNEYVVAIARPSMATAWITASKSDNAQAALTVTQLDGRHRPVVLSDTLRVASPV